jgi:hypothetical protein
VRVALGGATFHATLTTAHPHALRGEPVLILQLDPDDARVSRQIALCVYDTRRLRARLVDANAGERLALRRAGYVSMTDPPDKAA